MIVDNPGGLYPTLPNAVTAIRNRYSDPGFAGQFNQLPGVVQQALRAQDIERMRKGLMPAGADNMLKAGVAAATQDDVTPAPERSLTNVVGNAVDDVKLIGKSLTHIPGMLLEQIKSIPKFEEKYDENRAAGQNPVEAFLNLPLIQFLPGSYVAANVAGGNPGELARHPVFTALDVLPYAQKAAKSTKVFDLAEQEYLTALNTGRYARRPRPLSTVLTRKIETDVSFGRPIETVTPNVVGRGVEKLMDFAPTAKLSDLMGQKTVELSRMAEISKQKAQDRGFGNTFNDGDVVSQATRKLHRLTDDKNLVEEYGIDSARAAEIERVMTQTPDDIKLLAPNEQQYVNDLRDIGSGFADYMVENNMGLSYYQTDRWAQPEVFPTKLVDRFDRAEEAFQRNRTALVGGEWTIKAGSRKGQTRQVEGFLVDFERLANADPTGRFRQAYDLVFDGNYKAAATLLNRKQNYPTPRVGVEMVEHVLPNGTVGVKRLAGITDKRVGRLISTLDRVAKKEEAYLKLLADNPPARFSELIRDRAVTSYLNDLEERGVLGDRGQAELWVQQGVIDDIPGWDMDEYAKHQRGIASTWQKLQSAGEDPVYIPRVSTKQAELINRPAFNDRIRDPRTAKERVVDFSPSIKSPHIALTYQGMEIILRETSEEFTQAVQSKFGVKESLLRQRLRSEAETMAARDPRIDVFGATQDLMSKRYMPFDPEKHGVFGGSALTLTAQDRIWLPRQTAKALESLNREVVTSIKRLVDPVTGLMRVSLLPLSPRWHLYNMVGGALMLMAESGPGAFSPKNIRRTLDVLKAARGGAELPVQMSDEVARLLGYSAREEIELAFGRGSFLKRIFEESQAGRLAKGLIEKSFRANQHFDDMYRTMAYLYGEERGIAKGLTRKEAEAEGVRMARKVLQDSAALTPFERNVLRSVFPFYSWLSHIVRFAFNYPIDHPWRAAIVGGFARQVWEDMGDGATLEMLDVLHWGEPDEQGNKRGLSTRALNPFSDTGSLLTLGGWMGSMNPLGSTILDQLGVDRMSGGPELFPTLRYSTDTGRLVAQTQNPALNLLYNTVPQSQAVARLAGMDAEYRELRRVNPDAASRMLKSGFGLPILSREYSPEGQYAKAELQRQEARTKRISARLKKGDFAGLVKDGVPQETVDLLVRLRESGQLAEFDPEQNETVQALVPNPAGGRG